MENFEKKPMTAKTQPASRKIEHHAFLKTIWIQKQTGSSDIYYKVTCTVASNIVLSYHKHRIAGTLLLFYLILLLCNWKIIYVMYIVVDTWVTNMREMLFAFVHLDMHLPRLCYANDLQGSFAHRMACFSYKQWQA